MPKIPFWIFIVIALLYFTAVRVDTMDVDASQYAEMSREMMRSGDYLHLYDRGVEYLDKPPMLFWMSAMSMRVFGVNNFGYKLPSILFALWALFATWRLGRRLYNDEVGRAAALILATCQGMMLMTNDIRTDTILMSWVITAIWLIQEWVDSRRLTFLLGGAAAVAMGMMTKGPIALLVPGFCFVSDWVVKRRWNMFLQPGYFLALLVIALLLVPMSIGLYQQFDMHPEKLVNGKTGVSGLRFFYWSQSFGRITGESPWNNGAGMDFLLLNMLWSFLPWIFLFLPALFMQFGTLIRQRFRLYPGQEFITAGGFTLAYLALGSSAYQLPHYIFVAFPLASILTAHLVYKLLNERKHPKTTAKAGNVFLGISILILVVSLLLVSVVFRAGIWVIALCAAGTVAYIVYAIRQPRAARLLWLPAIAMVFANIFVTNFFYQPLLQYQAGSHTGRYISTHHIDTNAVVIYKMNDPLNAIQFYANGTIHSIDTLSMLCNYTYVLTMDQGLQNLTASGFHYSTVMQGQSFKVSELTLPFLNPSMRSSEVKNYYLIRIQN